MTGSVLTVCVSEKKGERKTPVASVELRPEHGIVGDAHAGEWHRQVSLLAIESIRKMQKMGLDVDSGDFAENITTEGINLVALPVGSQLRIGETLHNFRHFHSHSQAPFCAEAISCNSNT